MDFTKLYSIDSYCQYTAQPSVAIYTINSTQAMTNFTIYNNGTSQILPITPFTATT